MQGNDKIADLRWEDEELETHVYDSPPAMEDAVETAAAQETYEEAQHLFRP